MKRSLAAVGVLVLAIGVYAQEGAGDFMAGLGIAQEESGGGTLIFGRGEGNGVTGYYFWVEGHLIEVEIKDKGVKKKKEIEEIPDKGPVNKKLIDALRVRTKTKLPNARYLEIALDKTNGTDVKSYTLITKGDTIHVSVETDKGNVTMDLTDGKVVSK